MAHLKSVRHKMNRTSALLACLALAGCAVPQTRVAEDGVRMAVTQYLTGGETILGPFSTEGRNQLEVLSESDQAAASRLLAQGAVGFSVLIPDYCMSIEGKNEPPLRMVRIIFVRDGRVVGDFEVK